MNISDQISLAMVSYLNSSSIANSPTIVSGVSNTTNAENSSRLIVVLDNAELRKPSLPGLYDVSGYVNVIQSVDDTNAATKYREICSSVESVLGARSTVKSAIMAIDTSIFIYSYIWSGSSIAAGDRGFMATYNFSFFARNSNNTIT